ncbi:response regulator transcription factor [Fodinibius halophilus]|uniref:Helix-turn-helix transcriptional regulator n=1 Tax=Fodinibius halophilus TaxID=1736908 RepID=A0A6M1TDI9_9BACT|nr:helix-turn-helix transcriptional regulator [Fodinibius halophilus]NGP90081.1 helix-turn-helix transcriptional regulator [Fodinibius halophilus]
MEEDISREKLRKSINCYLKALLKLSQRESEVIELIARGYSTSRIADELNLSVRTIENHRYRICKKLKLKGRGALNKWVKEIRPSRFNSTQNNE